MSTHVRGTGVLEGHRIDWIDNLRTFMIFLVVLVHAGGVYESSGIWGYFWIVDDPATNDLSGLLFLVMDIFMMPTLFLISGFFAAMSANNTSGWVFLKSKFKRLIAPWIVAVLTVIPLYKIIFLYSRHLPQEPWTTYFHWSNGIWSQNWLWFLPVLFLFNMVYLLLSRTKIWFPQVSLKTAVLSTFLIGFVYSLSMDIYGLRGWTHTGLVDFQNERLLIYFMFFLLGVLCFRLRVFDAKPKSNVLYIIVNAFAWVPITVYVVFLLSPLFRPGQFVISNNIDKIILWLSYQLSLLCLVFATIETFRRYQDKRGKLRNELNKNSYYVYILHVVVTGSLALILLETAIPSLSKHFFLTVATFVASNLIISLFRAGWLPVRRVFKFTRKQPRFCVLDEAA